MTRWHIGCAILGSFPRLVLVCKTPDFAIELSLRSACQDIHQIPTSITDDYHKFAKFGAIPALKMSTGTYM